MRDVIAEHVGVIEADLEILKNDNVIQSQERNPEFRRTLAESVTAAQAEMTRIITTIDGVLGSA